MKRGGFALVIVLIALAIALYLSARNAAEMLPVLEGGGQPAAREVAGPGELPGLDAMQQATSQHTADVDALLSGDGSEDDPGQGRYSPAQ